jgi:hypothetical protein
VMLRKDLCPTDNAIRALVNIFKRNGCVHDEKRCGRPRTHVETLTLFARNATCTLYVPTTTVHRVLLSTLKKKPYHIQIPHDLHEEDEKPCVRDWLIKSKMTV